ncbi:MAG: hypothetical protein CVU56_18190 [Deltaproteobacteria bacterium HGW-Deltaproteobacteria-14]|jgi:hypothetical protein|nr:MAG: hypothetical protein CVU56_18190 [Deltaproteobacteria bacterium HGW-Deltaproteobacteria-14]
MAEAVETWSWGELFELDLPVDWEVQDHGDAIEICPVAGVGGIQLATLDAPEDEAPTALVARLVERFAATRGAAGPHPTAVEREPTGLTRARLRFDADDGHWLACAVTWHRVAVFVTAFARAEDARMLLVAEGLFDGLRPRDLPAAADLPPDAPGDF